MAMQEMPGDTGSVRGKIPWRRKWQPTPIFLPGEFHGQESSGLQSMGSQTVRQNCATNTFAFQFHLIVYSYFIHSRNNCTVQQIRKISVILCPYLLIGCKSSGSKGLCQVLHLSICQKQLFPQIKFPLAVPTFHPLLIKCFSLLTF